MVIRENMVSTGELHRAQITEVTNWNPEGQHWIWIKDNWKNLKPGNLSPNDLICV